jgi:hypothetical protein
MKLREEAAKRKAEKARLQQEVQDTGGVVGPGLAEALKLVDQGGRT